MVLFRSESDILDQEGDVYFLGEYSNPANANLAVNAMTILYQAQYRESQISTVRSEIDNMIYGLNTGDELVDQLEIPFETPVKKIIEQITETVERQLMRRYIPALLLAVEQGQNRSVAEQEIRQYLSAYGHKNDIERLIELTEKKVVPPVKNRLITLYCVKIDAVLNEQFDQLPSIVKEITELEEKLRESTVQ